MSPSLPSFEKESVGQMICLQGLFHKTIRVVILCGKFEASCMIKYSERWVEFKICFKILFMGLLKMDPDPEGPCDASGPEPGGRGSASLGHSWQRFACLLLACASSAPLMLVRVSFFPLCHFFLFLSPFLFMQISLFASLLPRPLHQAGCPTSLRSAVGLSSS